MISADQRKDVLDAQVALGPGETAHLTLADGTQLSAARGAGDYPDARVRASSDLAAQTHVAIDDLALDSSGPSARRIRWDVFRLP